MQTDFFDKRWVEVVLTIILSISFFLIKEIVRGFVKRHAKKYGFEDARTKYILKSFSIGIFILLLVSLFAVWNVETKSLYVYFGSFFTVAGVALFAQWSIISNVTASVVMFFTFPVKIGSKITIMDKDDSVTGIVYDITFFTIQLKTKEGNIVYFPTNVAIQKAMVEILDNPNPEEDITNL